MRGGVIAPLVLLALAGCIPQQGYAPVRQPAPEPRYQRPTIQPEQDVRALPAPRPAWETGRVAADARRVAASTYTVRDGESLRTIAANTGAGSEAVARANNIPAPFVIRAGQRLSIPAGRYHLVRPGQTGIAIARAYGVPWSRVIGANALAEPYILRTGQLLLIPDLRPQTMEERADAFHLDIDDIVTGGQPALAARAVPAAPTASPKRVLAATTPVAAPARLSGRFQWPVKGTILRRFGPGASGERSDGIKIAAPIDSPILAAADGVVAYVGSDIPALGGLVILRHGDRWTTVYGHASQLLVQRGQSVKKGQMIALSGNSGRADRPEVHFEIRQGRTPVDPLPQLPPR